MDNDFSVFRYVTLWTLQVTLLGIYVGSETQMSKATRALVTDNIYRATPAIFVELLIWL
jgi:hypothetical protein